MEPPNAIPCTFPCSTGTEPHMSVLEHQSIHIHKMPQWPTVPRGLAVILCPLFLIKPIFQFLVLFWYLCVKIPAPDAFIVQFTKMAYSVEEINEMRVELAECI